jgi:hypothetical protein
MFSIVSLDRSNELRVVEQEAPMTLVETMRQLVSEARERGRSPDHWEITPDALLQVRREAQPGELGGSEYAGLWTLDGLPLRESKVPGDKKILLIAPRR